MKVQGSDAVAAGSLETEEHFVLPSGGTFKALAVVAAKMLKGEKALLVVAPECACSPALNA